VSAALARSPGRGRESLAIGAVLVLFAVRFHALLIGGVLTFRDAGYFFGPWRTLFARQVTSGIPPVWNDASSCGRAMAANPNSGVFWPVTWAVPAIGTTGLVLADFALLLLAVFAALRMLGLSPVSAAAGASAVLFSGVAQTLPIVFTSLAALAPVPIALAAVATVDPARPAQALRRSAIAGGALGLSYFGGEPVITLVAGVSCAALALARAAAERRDASRAARRLALFGVTAAASLGIAAAQLAPATGELARSARGAGMRPEHGALYWSVEPARALTLLEPRLTGDPFAENVEDYWGAGTFDAGNPYFYDLALGLVPLALAFAAAADPRGRGALGVAALGAVLACGRHLPGYGLVGASLSIFRYPEKWWAISTLALAAAAAVALDAIAAPATRAKALRALALAAGVLAAVLLGGAGLAALSPESLKRLLFALRLGAGTADAARIARLLVPLLLSGAASMILVAGLAALVRVGRLRLGSAAAAAALLFLLDAGRRVAGTCPVSAPEILERETPASRAVASALGGGRFYDDGAERAEVAVARAREAGGYDPLRPDTGIYAGIRYAGESDVDRMTPARSVEWTRSTALLPWGEEKVARLRAAGVTVVRTQGARPDPEGVAEIARTGTDRVLKILRTRAELSLAREAVFVAPSADPRALFVPKDPLASAIVEADGETGTRPFAPGRVEVLSLAPHQTRARVELPGPGLLLVARTFDPSWRARVDGAPARLLRADGFLSALLVPPGTHEVELRYFNPLIALGGLVSALTALSLAAVLWLTRPR
jgi:hypothetical protein